MKSTPSPMHSSIFLVGPSFTEVTSIIKEPFFICGASSSITSFVLAIGTATITMSHSAAVLVLFLEYSTPNSSLAFAPVFTSRPVMTTSKPSSAKYFANVFPSPLVPPIIPIFIQIPFISLLGSLIS